MERKAQNVWKNLADLIKGTDFSQQSVGHDKNRTATGIGIKKRLNLMIYVEKIFCWIEISQSLNNWFK